MDGEIGTASVMGDGERNAAGVCSAARPATARGLVRNMGSAQEFNIGCSARARRFARAT